MRPTPRRARRSGCARALLAAACLLSIITGASIASADRRRGSVSACTTFTQADRDDDLVDFTIASTCTVPLACRVSWRLTCAPESRKRRRSLPSSTSFRIAASSSEQRTASAAACGDDGWVIDRVTWSCAPTD
jgi:hypothetical protein